MTLTRGIATGATAFARGFRTTFGAVCRTRGAAVAITTVGGAAGLRRPPPETSGSTNGTAAGVSASDHSRADPRTHAVATNTAASRRVPTAV